MSKLPIDSVSVVKRHRKNLGDITGLAESIRTVGLLHPIVVDSDHRLVAGERRLAACRKLGWTEVPATVVRSLSDASEALAAERDENTCRADFAPSEMVALGKALEELLPPTNKGGRPSKETGRNLHKVSGTEPGRTTTKVAKAVGTSPRTYEKARAVVDAAADRTQPAEVREVAREAVKEMDRTGKVDGAFRKVKEATREKVELSDILSDEAKAEIARRELAHDWAKAQSKIAQGVTILKTLSPEAVRAVASDADLGVAEVTRRMLDDWMDQLKTMRGRSLRSVGGR